MSALQTLRHARWLTRLVLVWFALFIGAAVASPMIQPVASQMVCSAMGGMKMVMDDESGQTRQATASMDCPLCAPMFTLPAPQALALDLSGTPTHAPHIAQAAHRAALSRAPLPPRGPPAS